jgi:putative long chain acyl-CoA synthase
MADRSLGKTRRRLVASARNALELLRFGRLGEDYGAPFDVVDQGPHHRLRHYASTDGAVGVGAPAILLVPPLMVTAEVYDVAPDISAVLALQRAGVTPYVVDFGAPEREAGGMSRTLDDHVRAVVSAIDRVAALTGRPVHLAGYSQGGMFAYQAAAFRRSENIASLVTFGSPVDVHRNLPAVRAEVTGALAALIEPALERLVERIEGLPGALTSTAFKLLSTRKEIQQRLEFVRLLHDRSALVRREARRRFLGGEGFVAWPGPAFKDFAREFLVHNRMLSGGFLIEGKTVTLADITCPILCFVGTADEIAAAASVRAIERAAPLADVSFVDIAAGHFGLVVGSRALERTWPTVAQWIMHREGRGPLPAALAPNRAPFDDDLDVGEVRVDIDLFFGSVAQAAREGYRRFGEAAARATDAIDALRYQEPRLRRLGAIDAETEVSPARELAEQARANPDGTFFLFRGRAFSYRDADTRVTNVARGLFACGVRPRDRVLVVMSSRPSLLSMTTALSRIGAVPVVAAPEIADAALRAWAETDRPKAIACDPEHAARISAVLGRQVLVLGGGNARAVSGDVIDMEAIDPTKIELPSAVVEAAGVSTDVAMVLLRPTDRGTLRPVTVTNHRWALSALGAAAATNLKPGETVLCAIPLYHPTALLACVGAAVVAGVRLALVEELQPEAFIAEARRVGATVVFYAGEMLRPLVHTEPSRADRAHPIRLFAGSGMRVDLIEKLRERFGVPTMEFYASTSLRIVLANVAGNKPGALGRPLPGSAEIAVLALDSEAERPARDERGAAILARLGEPGLLAARANEHEEWSSTRDLVRVDDDGDHWFVDSLAGMVRTDAGLVSTRAIEDALYALPEVTAAAAFADGEKISACYSSRVGIARERLLEAISRLPAYARPKQVMRVATVPKTEGFRVARDRLAASVDAAFERVDLD